MSFGISTHSLPAAHSYEAALDLWTRASCWKRGRMKSDTVRQLEGRKFPHKRIECTDDGAIVFWLHHTPVVTYHPDGRVSVVPYESKSTSRFADLYLPRGIYAYFSGQQAPILVLNYHYVLRDIGALGSDPAPARLYRLKERTTLVPTGSFPVPEAQQRFYGRTVSLYRIEDESTTAPFEKCVLNVRRGNAALRLLKYQDFATWLKAADGIGARRKVSQRTYYPYMKAHEIREQLEQGPEGWRVIRNGVGLPTKDLLERVRLAVYREHSCVDLVELPYVDNWLTVRAVVKSQKLYPWALYE